MYYYYNGLALSNLSGMNQKLKCEYFLEQITDQQKQLQSLFSFYQNHYQHQQNQSLANQRDFPQNNQQNNQQTQLRNTNAYKCNRISQIPEQQNEQDFFNQPFIDYEYPFQEPKLNNINYDIPNHQNSFHEKELNLNTNNFQQTTSQIFESYSNYSYNIHRKRRQNHSQGQQNLVSKSLSYAINSQFSNCNSNRPFKIKKKIFMKDENNNEIFYDPNCNICFQQNKGIILYDRNLLLNSIQNKVNNLQNSKSKERFKSDEKQMNQMLANLGIKSLNKLGKAKTERQIKNICSYLREGIIPQDYMHQFNELIFK